MFKLTKTQQDIITMTTEISKFDDIISYLVIDWEATARNILRDSYFEDYTKELVEDIGDLPNHIPSYLVIDWEATARNIQQAGIAD